MSWRHLSEVELTEYADGELAPAKVPAAEEHLRRCDACAGALAAARQGAAMAGRLQAAASPADLRQRVLARLATEPARGLGCGQAAGLMHAYLDRCLSPLLAAPFRAHLEGCRPCAEEFAQFARATQLVRSLPSVAAPAEVRARVAAAQVAQPRFAPSRGLRLRPVLAAAGVLAAGALVLLVRSAPEMPRAGSSVVVATRPPLPSVESRSGPASEQGPQAIAIAEARAGESGETASPARVPSPPIGRPTVTLAKAEGSAGGRAERTRPVPAPTVLAAASSALPAAMQALRTVALSAARDREPQRAMDLAAESFATLNCEEMLVRFPELAGASAGERAGERSAPAVRPTEPAPGSSRPDRNSAFAPGGLGAGVRASSTV